MKMIKSIASAMLIGIAAIGMATPSAKATVILDVVGGQLFGAQNVDVGGTLYDVTFVDGTCGALFSGCDNASDDFAFTNSSDAVDAANALLDQVFLDTFLPFDSNPELTSGCSAPNRCSTLIPHALDSTSFIFSAVFRTNFCCQADNSLSFTSENLATNTSTDPNFNFARFSLSESVSDASVPEPASLLLFSAGLVGLVGIRRRRRAA